MASPGLSSGSSSPTFRLDDGGQQQTRDWIAVQRALKGQALIAGQLASNIANLSVEVEKLVARQAHSSSSSSDVFPSDFRPHLKAADCCQRDSLDSELVTDFEMMDTNGDASMLGSRPGLFADADELKAKIRKNLNEPQYDVSIYYKKTGIIQAIARHEKFELGSLVLVIVSSFWLAIDVDGNTEPMLHDAKPMYQVVANIFCTLFLLELIVRFAAFRRLQDTIRDFWCMFDLVLVIAMVAETWVLSAIALVSDLNIASGNLRMLSIFRTLRLVRILRLAKVLRHVPELMVIVRGIGISLRAMVVVLALLGLVIYVNAIVFKVLMEGTSIGATKFGDVMSAMGTLLLDGALAGHKGGPVIREAWSESPIYAVLLFLFVLLANVTMMGVLTGLLVQTVKTVAEVEKEEKQFKHMNATMANFWRALASADEDGDGNIDEQELHKMLEDVKNTKILQKMDVDVESLVNLSAFIFEQHGGRLTQPEFTTVVMDLRGSRKATVKDHVETRKFFRSQLKLAGLVSDRPLVRRQSSATESNGANGVASEGYKFDTRQVSAGSVPCPPTKASSAPSLARPWSIGHARQWEI